MLFNDLINSGSTAGVVAAVLLLLYWIGVVVTLIWEDREPYDTLAWILGLMLLPGLGLILYFMVGRNWPAITQKRPWLHKMVAARRPFMNEIYARFRDKDEELLAQENMTVVGKVGKAIWAQNEAAPLPARTFEIYPDRRGVLPGPDRGPLATRSGSSTCSTSSGSATS